MPGDEPLAVGGDDHTQRADAVEPAGQAFDEALGHVLDDEDGGGEVAGRSPRIVASAGGPPVDAPKATTGGRVARCGGGAGSAARRARSLALGWVMTLTRLATRRWRHRKSAYCGDPAGTSRAPTTSTAPAAMAASGCSAAAPQTTMGVGAAAMMRSMVSSPPPKSSRSTSTVAGRSSLTRFSARCGVARTAGHDEARAGDQLLELPQPHLGARPRGRR